MNALSRSISFWSPSRRTPALAASTPTPSLVEQLSRYVARASSHRRVMAAGGLDALWIARARYLLLGSVHYSRVEEWEDVK